MRKPAAPSCCLVASKQCAQSNAALPCRPAALQLRVVFLNLVALGWTTSLILSSRTAPKLLKAA